MRKIYALAALLTFSCLPPLAASEKSAAVPTQVSQAAAGPTPGEALARLLEGNQRFVKGSAPHAGTPAQRAALAAGQKPFAAVLTCSDSRVPPELLFDQGLGDIFVVRVAGNVAGASEQGSIEYAAGHLGVPVLMVLGHTNCGAVKAASEGAREEGALGSLLKEIEPAVRSAKAHGAKGEGLAPAVVEENVRFTALNLMRKNRTVRKLVAEGKMKVSAAVYDLATGEVRLLDLQKDIRSERQVKTAALQRLLKKLKTNDLNEDERTALYSGLMDVIPSAE